ncbi:hypothetical protein IU438_16915 [Nocardia cyriacigeorgica]|uniref:hypothetical protein n=1 Tax=Nocardia cyriacigeorgica TaxID=135487 RepID=UPI001894334D|nr:hypothetical protein [Nocardia cyriacigeorgica]MBF6397470.1 hypothetical protein [Nocardia cyriacigeorgica]MBF6402872.1 hypothetical protein [Nocardia cyriacigeorgica]
MDNTDHRMTLMCYNDTHGYGWHHVDLFLHDREGREVNWVHWQVDEDGPAAADRITAVAEPALRRVSDWLHGVSASGMDYWSAEAVWDQP